MVMNNTQFLFTLEQADKHYRLYKQNMLHQSQEERGEWGQWYLQKARFHLEMYQSYFNLCFKIFPGGKKELLQH